MLKHFEITRQRLAEYSNPGYFERVLYPHCADVNLSVFSAPGRISYNEAVSGSFRPAAVGDHFGPLWSTHWFKVEMAIPESWNQREVHFLWDSSSEACVWVDGQPLQGLTGSSSGWADGALRREFCLSKSASGDQKRTLYVEIACNGLFGLSGGQSNLDNIGRLRQAEIAVFDRRTWDLYWDLKVIADMALNLPADSPRAGQALYAANTMLDQIDLDDSSTWPAARQTAALFFASRNGDGQHNLSAIGHAHIDTAWLWPLAETRRKCTRTFASAVRYMEDYPDYRFACSQAVQFEWIKETHPELYEKIKTKAREGRFIPAGGSWVEPDCNIPSGESLVRQFLFGQRFFKQEFGVQCQEFWEPDVFGYSAALPQILNQVGMRYFLTQKLSWNQFNRLPSHTFLWEGLDGSRVLTHFPPADTYNSVASVKEILYTVHNYKDHERSRESYLLFGYGDGGGGPTPAMLEQLARMHDVEGLPRVEMRSPAAFFSRLEADLKDPLVWTGELYFEYHRGTYTTQAHNKRYNRRSEFMLHNLEFLGTLNHVLNQGAYPAAELTALWKTLLTNQFHDIIPGSSIREVYEDSTVEYEAMQSKSAEMLAKSLESLLPPSSPSSPSVLNTLSFERREVVELDFATSTAQVSAAGKPLAIAAAPALGYAPLVVSGSPEEKVTVSEDAQGFILENTQLRAVVQHSGVLTSLIHKASGRETLQPGEGGNRLVMFDDHSIKHDAWDVDVYHLEKYQYVAPAVSARIIETGPIRASLEFEYRLSPQSWLRQIVSLDAIAPHLDFANEVEWRESHKFLKVEFPLNVRSQNATYEIQFGHIQRPTHFNTSWDLARFEVCGHRWADLSEHNFGVALLNDCKYGYSTHANVMRLSLLRSPKAPDPEADMGRHQFRYALMPHSGAFQEAGVIQRGYAFNQPLLIVPNRQSGTASFFQVDQNAVIIDTLKKAEDSGDVIVRLYEAYGWRGQVRLTSPFQVKEVTRCNLLEEDIEALAWKDGGVNVEVRPFQILTLKLHIA